MFKNKVAIVTGSGAGQNLNGDNWKTIGQATAQAFAAQGAKVVVVDIREDAGQETVNQIHAAGGEAIFVKTDVQDENQVAAMVQAAVARFGRIDFCVNNAGIEGAAGPVHEMSQENFHNLAAINIGGVLWSMKHELRQMLAQGQGGSIVNVSSFLGKVGFAGMSMYAASKHAVLGMTKSAALEYVSAGIRVNAICPGVVKTPMCIRFVDGNEAGLNGLAAMAPTKIMVTPEEVAATAIFLCSDAAKSIIGAEYVVDGGILVS